MSEETTTAPQWGCPWHGVLRCNLDSQGKPTSSQYLTLGNGSVMAWRSTYADTWLSHYGTVFAQSMPNAMADPETPEAMTAEGMEWRDYALVAPAERSEVHNIALGPGGWIYWDAQKQWPWKINFYSQRVNSSGYQFSAVNLTFSANPSGFILKPWDGLSKTIQLPVDQASPALSSAGWLYSTPRITIVDAVPDGSKVIIGVFVYGNPTFRGSPTSFTMNDATAIGYWLLEISGSPFGDNPDFDVQATELATRSDCLGSVSDTPMPTAQVMTNNAGPTNFTSFQTDGAGDPGVRPGVEPLPIVSNAFLTTEEIGTAIREITGKVIGYWFDELGDPYPVTMDHEGTRTRSSSYSEEVLQDDLERIYPVSGNSYPQGAAEGAAERTVINAAYETMKLAWKGQFLTIEASSVVTITQSWHYFFDGTQLSTNDYSRRHAKESTLPGWEESIPPGGSEQVVTVGPGSVPDSAVDSALFNEATSLHRGLNLARWCDKAFGSVSRPSGNAGVMAVSRVLTPDGPKGVAGVYPVSHKYGTYHPVTGDCLFAERHPVRYT
ncbi:MAG: hypothetical protein JKY26_06760 [Pseudomonas sp.]|nr:hypothetical protein [Pseudomonas sp.]